MTPDQRERLKVVSDLLFEVMIYDIDPDNWTGNGKPSRDLNKAERGDALWCRKIAGASLTIYSNVQRLLNDPLAPASDEPDFDKLIEDAERKAADALRQACDRTRTGG